jgi:hypothetical protein
MLNLYRVISEELTATVPILDDGSGPEEDYRIAELVVAGNAARARWTAWRNDRDSFTGNIIDIPKFSVRLKVHDVDLAPGLCTHDKRLQWAWFDEDDLCIDPVAEAEAEERRIVEMEAQLERTGLSRI